ncbi:MAG: putative LPLAT superfamily acyltransferase [Paracoccaceae bacterium]|jgi:predicted LPLAT superfamily acyltransferase
MSGLPSSDQNTGKATHWARIEERGVYAGLRIMLLTHRVFGRRGFGLLLYPVIGYFFVAGGAARRASLTFFSRVHSHRSDAFEAPPGWRQSFRHFLSFGDALLDKLEAWSGKINEDDIVYHNREIFDELQQSGRGGLLIASHLGNMEVCRALGELSLDLKLNVLVHTKHAANFNRLLRRVSPDSSVSLIQTTEVDPGTAIMLHDRVARGEFVIIVGDRTPVTLSGRTSWAPFLGHSAPFPQGPYILASLLECPVQLIFCLKRDRRYHIVFEAFADAIRIPRRERNTALEEWTHRYVRRLEHYCSTDPYQWFNFFDFWRQAETMPPPDDTNTAPKG